MGDGDSPIVTLRLANELLQRVRESASASWGEDRDGIVLCLLITCQWVLLTPVSQRGQSINQFPYLPEMP